MGRLYPAMWVLILAALSCASTAFSQDATSAEVSTRPTEEITVVGQRTLLGIRYQIRREEDNLYRLFNELNSNDEFDIKCRMVKRLSHIARRECEPRFLSKARSANAIMGLADMRSGAGGADPTSQESGTDGADLISLERGVSLLESESELAAGEGNKFDAMNEEIFRLAMENPDYLKILMRVNELKTEYEAEWQQRFGKK